MNKLVLFPAFLMLLPLASFGGDDDFQLWTQFSKGLYKKGKFDLRFYMEGRYNNDAHDALGYFFGPTFQYKVNKTLSLGGAAKMIHFKSGEHFLRLQRYEGEFSLNFKQLSWIKFQNRNRFEYFRREDADRKRSRLRLKFTVPLKSKGPLRGVFFGNEFFYDHDKTEMQRNRLTPIGLSFKLDKKRSINVFYLLEHMRASGVDNHVLGTYLTF